MAFPKKILIVEDDDITQRHLQSILHEKGVEYIVCVDDAESAIKALQEDVYDMAIIDINIKGVVDGLQLSKKILDNHIIALAFITAYTDDETIEAALKVGPYTIITKPFTQTEVIVSVQVAYKRFLTHEKAYKYYTPPEEKQDTVKINKSFSYASKSEILYYNEVPVRLSIKQRKLIGALVANINNTVIYEALNEAIWADPTLPLNSLRTLVYTIRKQFPELYIISHSKAGYALYIEKSL